MNTDSSTAPKQSITKNFFDAIKVTAPILLIILGCAIGGYLFGDKASKIETEGVTTTAEVYKVSIDALGEVLDVANVSHRKKAGRVANYSSHWKLHYRFVSEDGKEITSSFNVQAPDAPATGETFEVRYAASNPSLHEKGTGHTKSQTSALYWIALIFWGIWFVSVLWLSFKPTVPRQMTTREKRLRRMEELEEAKINQ